MLRAEKQCTLKCLPRHSFICHDSPRILTGFPGQCCANKGSRESHRKHLGWCCWLCAVVILGGTWLEVSLQTCTKEYSASNVCQTAVLTLVERESIPSIFLIIQFVHVPYLFSVRDLDTMSVFLFFFFPLQNSAALCYLGQQKFVLQCPYVLIFPCGVGGIVGISPCGGPCSRLSGWFTDLLWSCKNTQVIYPYV